MNANLRGDLAFSQCIKRVLFFIPCFRLWLFLSLPENCHFDPLSLHFVLTHGAVVRYVGDGEVVENVNISSVLISAPVTGQMSEECVMSVGGSLEYNKAILSGAVENARNRTTGCSCSLIVLAMIYSYIHLLLIVPKQQIYRYTHITLYVTLYTFIYVQEHHAPVIHIFDNEIKILSSV